MFLLCVYGIIVLQFTLCAMIVPELISNDIIVLQFTLCVIIVIESLLSLVCYVRDNAAVNLFINLSEFILR